MSVILTFSCSGGRWCCRSFDQCTICRLPWTKVVHDALWNRIPPRLRFPRDTSSKDLLRWPLPRWTGHWVDVRRCPPILGRKFAEVDSWLYDMSLQPDDHSGSIASILDKLRCFKVEKRVQDGQSSVATGSWVRSPRSFRCSQRSTDDLPAFNLYQAHS